MGFHLRSVSSGKTIHVSGGHWAVYLNVAEAFGWKPAGTVAPPGSASGKPWNGQYDSNDGQLVTDADAKSLAAILHSAAVGPQIAYAVTDTIRRIEGAAESSGLRIPEGMRMHFEHFVDELSPLLEFLYEGAFTIDGPPPPARKPSQPPPAKSNGNPVATTAGVRACPPLTSLLPFVHNARWAGWDGTARRTLDGTAETAATPLYGIATVESGTPRVLSVDELLASGDPTAIESTSMANLDRLPHAPFETVERTKGVLGLGKKPLAVSCRGPYAAERALSRTFLAEARAALGNPQAISVAIPDKQTIVVRNHDAPHFGSAFEVMSEHLKKSFAGGAAEAVCKGIAVIRDAGVWGASYVRAPEALASYDRVTYATREVPDPSSKLFRSRDEELEATQDLAPPSGVRLRLRGRHRQSHFLELDLFARSAHELDDATRAYLAGLARAVPGTLVWPLTGIRVIVEDAANEAAYERMLRHPNVLLCVPTGKKRELRAVSGPSARMQSDNLSRPLSALAADSYL